MGELKAKAGFNRAQRSRGSPYVQNVTDQGSRQIGSDCCIRKQHTLDSNNENRLTRAQMDVEKKATKNKPKSVANSVAPLWTSGDVALCRSVQFSQQWLNPPSTVRNCMACWLWG